MPSYSLANWNGTQSAQDQRPEQNLNRPVGSANVDSAKLARGQSQEGRSNASLAAQFVEASQISYTPKTTTDISRIFDDDIQVIPNGHAREDDMHSDDAEGEFVYDDEVMIVDQMLQPPPPSPSLFSSLFSNGPPTSPSISIEGVSPIPFTSQSHESLFTPPPSPSPPPVPKPKPKRVVMSHVSIPPFPGDLRPSDYRLIPPKRPLPRPTAKKKRALPQVQTHMSMGDALNAALMNNGALKTVSSGERFRAGIGSSDSGSVSSLHMSASEAVKQRSRRQAGELGAHYGGSAYRQAKAKAKVKAKSVQGPAARYASSSASASGSASASVSVSMRPSQPQPAPPAPAPAPPRRPKVAAYAKYNSQKDEVRLYINGIPEHKCEVVLSLNTRFIQQRRSRSQRGENMSISMPDEVEAEREGGGGGGRMVREEDRPLGLTWEAGGVGVGMEDELTTGGFLEPWEGGDDEDDEEGEDEEEDEDEDGIVFLGMNNPRHQAVQEPPMKTPAPPGPKRAIRVGEPLGVERHELPPPPPPSSLSPLQVQARPKPRPRIAQGNNGSSNASAEPEPRNLKKRRADDDEYRPQQRPSAKALGKRRATSSERLQSQRPPPSLSAPPLMVPPKSSAGAGPYRAPAAAPQILPPPSPSAPARPVAKLNLTTPAIPNTAAIVPAPPAAPSSQGRPQSAFRPIVPRPAAAAAASRIHAAPAVVPAHTPTPEKSAISENNNNTVPPATPSSRSRSRPPASGFLMSPDLSVPVPPGTHNLAVRPSSAQIANIQPSFIASGVVPLPRPLGGPSLSSPRQRQQNLATYGPSSFRVTSSHHPMHAPSVTDPRIAVSVHTVPPPGRVFLASPVRPIPSPFFRHTNAHAHASTSPFLAAYEEEEPGSPTKLFDYHPPLGSEDGMRNGHGHAANDMLLDLDLEGGRPGAAETTTPSPWVDDLSESAMEQVQVPGFGNGTIDPSLLGGGQDTLVPLVMYQSREASPASVSVVSSPLVGTLTLPLSLRPQPPLVMYSSPSLSRSPSPPGDSPRALSHRSRSSSRSLSPTRSVLASPPGSAVRGAAVSGSLSGFGPSHDPPSDSSSSSDRPLASRTRQPRRTPDGMIATGDLQLTEPSDDERWSPSDEEKLKRRKKPARLVSVMRNPGDPESDHEEKRPAKATTTTTKPGKKNIVKRKRMPFIEWPEVEEAEYCHHCRTKSKKFKYICPCEKRYCIRCLSTKYTGDLAYDLARARTDFTCPVCRNNCTCDICTRKRGEVYVSSRPRRGESLEPAPAERTRKKNNKEPPNLPATVVRPQLGGKTNLPAPAVSGPVTYWATMYGLDGEQIGRAFVGNDGKEDVVVVRPLGEGGERRERRVFVGEIQEVWGFDRCLVKDVDPISWRDRNKGPNERMYVGNKARLYESARRAPRMYVDTLAVHNNSFAYEGDGFSSPLSSIGDESDVGGADEGESCQGLEASVMEADFEMVAQGDVDSFLAKGPGSAFSADSLTDVDVVRAISLSFRASGMPVQISAS